MHLMLRLRGGMLHTSSGVISRTNPLACTCYASLPASVKRGGGEGGEEVPFIHGCGIEDRILEANTFCPTCRVFNCGVRGHGEGGKGGGRK